MVLQGRLEAEKLLLQAQQEANRRLMAAQQEATKKLAAAQQEASKKLAAAQQEASKKLAEARVHHNATTTWKVETERLLKAAAIASATERAAELQRVIEARGNAACNLHH